VFHIPIITLLCQNAHPLDPPNLQNLIPSLETFTRLSHVQGFIQSYSQNHEGTSDVSINLLLFFKILILHFNLSNKMLYSVIIIGYRQHSPSY